MFPVLTIICAGSLSSKPFALPSMSFGRALSSALYRTIDQAKLSLASAVRMDVIPPTSEAHAALPLYTITSQQDLNNLATGCDADMGGSSKMRLELNPEDGKGRFWGTLSNEVPRNAKLERSGYAGFRNRHRPTLFGQQTWDTTMHPYLRLRVRNRLANLSSPQSSSSPTRSALWSADVGSRTSTYARARHALGLNAVQTPGPKFFVNVQTDGPVTTDLFQHRLFLDDREGDKWQDVILPLSDFVLTNSGQVAPSQVGMLREKIRSVGISVMIENPMVQLIQKHDANAAATAAADAQPPSALQQPEESEGGDVNSTKTRSMRGSRRSASYQFDLGIESIDAISEELLGSSQDEKNPA